jgi:membrane protease subunit HflK
MERILGNSQKLVYDGGPGTNIVPYLPLNELSPPRTTPPAPGQQQSGGAR